MIRIMELLETTKLGDYPLAKAIGLDKSAIQHWKRGDAKPSIAAIIKIADYFNVSIDYLVGRTDKHEVNK